MRVIVAVAVLVAGAVSGCGAELSADDLAREMSRQTRESDGSTFSNVQCVKRQDHVFRCVGDYKASRAAAEESLGPIDTSGWGDREWAVIEARGSGQVALDVTVGDDGSWVSAPAG